jgi:tetratricopeptide (TPR) repeat protein
MSPEQAAGSQELDGRSDVFSLACVIYEMITGMQAYIGPTDEAVIAMRFVHPPRDLRVYRPAASPALDTVLQKAFAITPADRYRTALAMVHALDDAVSNASVPSSDVRKKRSGRVRTVVAGITVTAALGAALLVLPHSDGAAVPSLDAKRFAVFPADGDGPGASADVVPLLREAMLQWRGITVADAYHVQDVLTRGSGARMPHDLRRAAEHLGAGRYVTVQSRVVGDSLRISAALFESLGNERIVSAQAFVDVNLQAASAVLSRMAETLLFPEGAAPGSGNRLSGTQSHPAHEAYLRGHAFLEQWDLSGADSALQVATAYDPTYAQAHLWLAQVRSWKREPPARWAFAAERAAASADRLSARDARLAAALVEMVGPRRDHACSMLAQIAETAPYDFATWYGLGNCLAFDSTVVRNPRSPSGWSFRSSYDRALQAYDRAFRLLPSIHRSFRGGWFADIQRLLKTQPSMLRKGTALAPDTGQFVAYPSWRNGSLEFIPFRTATFDGLGPVRSSTVNEAILEQRKRFHALTTMWRAAYPHSVDALHAVAASLDLLGDPSALDTIRLARTMAQSSGDLLRVGTMEVWMRVKRSVPADTAALKAAVGLADSLLRLKPSDAAEARLLGSLAALRGRGHLAAALAVDAERANFAPPIADAAPRFLAYAALGGPAESLHVQGPQIVSAIRARMTVAEQNRARYGVLLRGALLMMPARSLVVTDSGNTIPERMLRSFRGRDHSAAVEIIRELERVRSKAIIRAFDQTLDAIYTEGALLAAVGDSTKALEWISPALDSLAFAAPQSLADHVRAASLVRLMALRSGLETAIGRDSLATLWRDATTVLWRDADAFLRPPKSNH